MPDAVDRLDVLLLPCLCRHKMHIRPADSLADRRGIVLLVLGALTVWLDELRTYQLYPVAQLPQLPGPVIGGSGGLNADQTRSHIGKEWQHLVPGKLKWTPLPVPLTS